MVLYRLDRGRSAAAPSAAPTAAPSAAAEPPENLVERRGPRLVLAVAVAASAAVFAVGVADTSWAFPGSSDACGRGDVMVSVVAGAPRAGQGSAQVQYTARSGRSCTLTGSQPVSLVGADGVAIMPDESFAAVSVTVSRGHPAHQTLRWNLSADPGHRVEPTALLARTSNWSGDPVRWAWRFGPISTAPGDNRVDVGWVRSGPALPVAAGAVGAPEG